MYTFSKSLNSFVILHPNLKCLWETYSWELHQSCLILCSLSPWRSISYKYIDVADLPFSILSEIEKKQVTLTVNHLDGSHKRELQVLLISKDANFIYTFFSSFIFGDKE